MAVLGDLLFYRRDQFDLDAALRQQASQIRDFVDRISDKLFAEKADEDIAEYVASTMALNPLVVDFDSATSAVQETHVEARDPFFGDGPVRVPGLKATKTIPFKGDEKLWFLRTNPYDLNPPRGEVRGDKLTVGIEVPAQQADEAAKYIAETIARIPEYLKRQEAQIERHNADLATHALQWIKQRRGRLGQAADLLKKLGG